MPELPEVETIVRGLAPRLKGRRIVSVELLAKRIVHGEPGEVAGRKIRAVRRHGKFIVIELEGETRPLGIHLGMTGKLLLDTDRGPYTRAVFTLDRGALRYDDVRQFGRIEWSEALERRIGGLGPDPLSIEAAAFTEMLRGRRAMVKPLLLNQRFLRGMGNIYTDESLFRARIHPRAIAAQISKSRAAALYRAIQEVLAEAIEDGGSSVSDYIDADGREGSFQDSHRVYGREGEPCTSCSAPIRRIVVGQRGTHFCPRCQRLT